MYIAGNGEDKLRINSVVGFMTEFDTASKLPKGDCLD